jgi:hypothetical protein|tara:strand:+ start:905 stop:1279 length:375 start_codon:yes stop_codon:yes gene_type:complete
MSILKVDTLQNISGNKETTIDEMLNGRAKVWWNYDQTTPSVTNSFNISSITDNATGQYTANFSVTLSNPCGVTSSSFNGDAHDAGYADIVNCFAQNTNAEVDTRNMAGANFDCEFNYGVIFDNT